jgi:hypothetical protein
MRKADEKCCCNSLFKVRDGKGILRDHVVMRRDDGKYFSSPVFHMPITVAARV